MRVNCAVLGFSIDPDAVCSTKAGKQSECRKCEAGRKSGKGGGNITTPVDSPGEKRKARKRCECGRLFLPKSNRQERCERCRKWNNNEKTRARMARFRKKAKTRAVVTI